MTHSRQHSRRPKLYKDLVSVPQTPVMVVDETLRRPHRKDPMSVIFNQRRTTPLHELNPVAAAMDAPNMAPRLRALRPPPKLPVSYVAKLKDLEPIKDELLRKREEQAAPPGVIVAPKLDLRFGGEVAQDRHRTFGIPLKKELYRSEAALQKVRPYIPSDAILNPDSIVVPHKSGWSKDIIRKEYVERRRQLYWSLKSDFKNLDEDSLHKARNNVSYMLEVWATVEQVDLASLLQGTLIIKENPAMNRTATFFNQDFLRGDSDDASSSDHHSSQASMHSLQGAADNLLASLTELSSFALQQRRQNQMQQPFDSRESTPAYHISKTTLKFIKRLIRDLVEAEGPVDEDKLDVIVKATLAGEEKIPDMVVSSETTRKQVQAHLSEANLLAALNERTSSLMPKALGKKSTNSKKGKDAEKRNFKLELPEVLPSVGYELFDDNSDDESKGYNTPKAAVSTARPGTRNGGAGTASSPRALSAATNKHSQRSPTNTKSEEDFLDVENDIQLTNKRAILMDRVASLQNKKEPIFVSKFVQALKRFLNSTLLDDEEEENIPNAPPKPGPKSSHQWPAHAQFALHFLESPYTTMVFKPQKGDAEHDALIKVLHVALDAPYRDLQWEAALLLIQTGWDADIDTQKKELLVQLLREMFQDSNVEAQRDLAAIALSRYGEATPEIIAKLIEALGEIDPDEGDRPETTVHRDSERHFLASEALKSLGKEHAPLLIELCLNVSSMEHWRTRKEKLDIISECLHHVLEYPQPSKETQQQQQQQQQTQSSPTNAQKETTTETLTVTTTESSSGSEGGSGGNLNMNIESAPITPIIFMEPPADNISISQSTDDQLLQLQLQQQLLQEQQQQSQDQAQPQQLLLTPTDQQPKQESEARPAFDAESQMFAGFTAISEAPIIHLSEELIDKLIKSLIDLAWNDWNDQVRLKASAILGRLKRGKEVFAMLRDNLENQSPTKRTDALRCLKYFGAIASDAISVYLKCFKDPFPGVRVETCRVASALRLSERDVVNALIDLMDDVDSAVRVEVAIALGRCNSLESKVVETLLYLTQYDTHPRVRIEGIKALEELDVVETYEDVQDALVSLSTSDQDPSVRKQAADTLSRFGVHFTTIDTNASVVGKSTHTLASDMEHRRMNVSRSVDTIHRSLLNTAPSAHHLNNHPQPPDSFEEHAEAALRDLSSRERLIHTIVHSTRDDIKDFEKRRSDAEIELGINDLRHQFEPETKAIHGKILRKHVPTPKELGLKTYDKLTNKNRPNATVSIRTMGRFEL